MDALCHHIRNATTIIEGLAREFDGPKRLEIHQQLKRIENELLAYQIRETKKINDYNRPDKA